MFTTVAWSESNTPDGTYQKLAGVPDQSVKVIGDSVIISEYNRLFGGVVCGGALALQGRFVAPSIRRINPNEVAPVVAAIVPGAAFSHSVTPNNSVPLETSESLEVELLATAGAARVAAIGAWLSSAPIAPVKGKIITVNASITITLVAGAWAFSELTFDSDLPIQDFDIVGARAIIPTGVLFRFVFVGKTQRPGAICSAAKTTLNDRTFRYGNIGKWGTFNAVQAPGIEVLGSVADAEDTYEMFIDLMA